MKLARVQEIITDKELQEKYYNFYGKENSIGSILFTFIDDPTPVDFDCSNCKLAKPFNYNISHYPVPGELVHVTIEPHEDYNKTGKKIYYYHPPISIYQLPTSDAYPDSLDSNNEFYKGQYFPDPSIINPLLPYEGDITIEGRFGQSIRFGSTIDNNKVSKPNRWSNEGAIGNPITIIRNGQSSNLKNIEGGERILEDIDGDHSSMYLCSDQQLSNFQPASLHDESYGQDIFKEIQKEEPVISDNEMTSDVKEDVELNRASNLPAEELQQIEESIEDTEFAYYEIEGTSLEDLDSDFFKGADDLEIPSSYNIPDNINTEDL